MQPRHWSMPVDVTCHHNIVKKVMIVEFEWNSRHDQMTPTVGT